MFVFIGQIKAFIIEEKTEFDETNRRIEGSMKIQSCSD